MSKRCAMCGETMQTNEFSKDARNPDGLNSSCRGCKSITAAKWKAANPEKKRAANAAWKAANPDKVKAINTKWYSANSDKHKASVAKWRAENPEKEMANKAAWYAANRERKNATDSAWVKANPAACRIHLQNRRARKASNGGKLSKGLAEKLFRLQRGKCACGCKQPLGDDYHLDHRMPIALGGANEDWNIQLLRRPCNLSKHAKHPVDFMQQRGFLL